MDEQFWGRAARASSDSKESGRLFNFVDKKAGAGCTGFRFLGTIRQLYRPYLPINSA
jgi:hypothetical protein